MNSRTPYTNYMTKPDISSTTRFSNRVQNYTRYRPSYPADAIQWIVSQYQLGPQSVVADIGSGTGIFTQLLMQAGLQVCAVEPNLEMRLESDRLHSTNPLYSSLSGTAEATLLGDNSVDVVAAAQAGHWFDLEKSKREFQRILRPGGVLVLVWNRRMHSSPFQTEYEQVLNSLPEYAKVNHNNLDDGQIAKLFTGHMERRTFANSQQFDQLRFRGRVFSSSYTPSEDDSEYEAFSRKIDAVFSTHSDNGTVSFAYTTQVYSGILE